MGNPNPPRTPLNPLGPRILGPRILELLDTGLSQNQVARQLGVTKNTVAGIWARAGRGTPKGPEPSTIFERLDEMHRNMDRVLAQPIGRITDQ